MAAVSIPSYADDGQRDAQRHLHRLVECHRLALCSGRGEGGLVELRFHEGEALVESAQTKAPLCNAPSLYPTAKL